MSKKKNNDLNKDVAIEVSVRNSPSTEEINYFYLSVAARKLGCSELELLNYAENGKIEICTLLTSKPQNNCDFPLTDSKRAIEISDISSKNEKTIDATELEYISTLQAVADNWDRKYETAPDLRISHGEYVRDCKRLR